MNPNPSVTFLVPYMSAPALGAVTTMAHMLTPHFPVQVLGPDLGEGISPMYQGQFPYTVVKCPNLYRFPDYFRESRALARHIEGNLIIADKAFCNTTLLALREKRKRGCKVIVYLDEWDGAAWQMLSGRERMSRRLKHWHHPLETNYFPVVEKQISGADTVISTSTFLQKKFGGHLMYLGADTEVFKPQDPGETRQLKTELGLAGFKLIVFGGLVRPHKGIEQILAALQQLDDDTVRLVVVGPETDFLRALQAQPAIGQYIIALGSRPKAEMPRYLDLADLVVLPLNDTLLSRSQTPCKIFEAMAMGKPIIASAVSDIPHILEDCGQVVSPGDVDAMAAHIRWVLDHPAEAAALGGKARAKCLAHYSRPIVEDQLVRIVREVAGGL